MKQMGGGVVAHNIHTPRRIHLREGGVAHPGGPARHRPDVDHQPFDGEASVLDLNLPRGVGGRDNLA